MYCDNKVAINIVNNFVMHDRIKHVEIDRYFIKKRFATRKLCLLYIKFEKQTTDIFTKRLLT